jgi:hypothetical protein
VLAAVAVAASSAAGVMVLEAGTVLAPEPVVTTQTLTNGATTEVISVNTPPPPGYWVWPDGIARPYIRWYPEFVCAPWLAAGTPCSVVVLPVDQVATNVIIAYGNYKRCS